jgi:hypothetical protein
MEAGYLLRIYQVRKTGYEGGLLKYPPSLYAAVCVLVVSLVYQAMRRFDSTSRTDRLRSLSQGAVSLLQRFRSATCRITSAEHLDNVMVLKQF